MPWIDDIAARVATIPNVVAVTLGGSRAQGRHDDGADWDVGLYYRGTLDPDDVRALGWNGEVYGPGDWGGGVMNGGAWLEIDGERVDLIYRDLDEVEHWWFQAEAGHFEIQHLSFYAAGIPTYAVVGELALQQVLVGELPRPTYPDALRESAERQWSARAEATLTYTEKAHAWRGDPVGTAALLGRAVIEAAHARLAAAGTWVLNEKRIVTDAGLRGATAPVFAALGSSPIELVRSVEAIRAAISSR